MSEVLRWLEDMQACDAGEHGPWWAERFEQSVLDSVAGKHDGSWQVWRDIRQSETPPSSGGVSDE